MTETEIEVENVLRLADVERSWDEVSRTGLGQVFNPTQIEAIRRIHRIAHNDGYMLGTSNTYGKLMETFDRLIEDETETETGVVDSLPPVHPKRYITYHDRTEVDGDYKDEVGYWGEYQPQGHRAFIPCDGGDTLYLFDDEVDFDRAADEVTG